MNTHTAIPAHELNCTNRVHLHDVVEALSIYPSHTHSVEHGETFHAADSDCMACKIARSDIEHLNLAVLIAEYAPDRFNTVLIATTAGTFLIDADAVVKVLDEK